MEKKGRTKEELNQVIEWLTGFDDKKMLQLIKDKVSFETFFQQASLNANAKLITGLICGYRVEQIENPLTQKVRYLDKLVDELAKGRKIEKILHGQLITVNQLLSNIFILNEINLILLVVDKEKQSHFTT